MERIDFFEDLYQKLGNDYGYFLLEFDGPLELLTQAFEDGNISLDDYIAACRYFGKEDQHGN